MGGSPTSGVGVIKAKVDALRLNPGRVTAKRPGRAIGARDRGISRPNVEQSRTRMGSRSRALHQDSMSMRSVKPELRREKRQRQVPLVRSSS